MAEKEEKENVKGESAAEGAGAKKRKKKGLALGGGILGLVAAAYTVSLIALPGASKEVPFGGPYVIALTPEDVQVNLSGDGAKRYMVMTLQAEYDAYGEVYAKARVADPLYQAKLNDILISLGRQKSKEDIDDLVGEEAFKAEVREAVDPLLFPMHVGNELESHKGHEESGLLPGVSIAKSTMRGGFHSHAIHLDGRDRTISLDDGPTFTFEGTETNLELENSRGQVVFVDVTGVDRAFVGDVPVGTFGRLRAVLFGKLLVQ